MRRTNKFVSGLRSLFPYKFQIENISISLRPHINQHMNVKNFHNYVQILYVNRLYFEIYLLQGVMAA